MTALPFSNDPGSLSLSLKDVELTGRSGLKGGLGSLQSEKGEGFGKALKSGWWESG